MDWYNRSIFLFIQIRGRDLLDKEGGGSIELQHGEIPDYWSCGGIIHNRGGRVGGSYFRGPATSNLVRMENMAHRRCPPTPPSLYPRVQPSSPRSLLALTGLYSYVRPVVFPLEALAPVAAIRVARSYSRRLINLAGPRRISSVRVSSLDRRSALPPPTPLRARFDSPFRNVTVVSRC